MIQGGFICPACSGTGRTSHQEKGPKNCKQCGGSGLIKKNVKQPQADKK